MKIKILLALSLSLLACAVSAENKPARRDVSIISVLANPERYDGTEVTLRGFLVEGMEYENVLFLDKNAYENELFDRSIGISYDAESDGLVAKHKCSYVQVTGHYSFKGGVVGVGQLVSVVRILPIKRSTCGASDANH